MSYTRAKEMPQDPARWGLPTAGAAGGVHPVLQFKALATSKGSADAGADTRHRALIAAVDSFRRRNRTRNWLVQEDWEC